MTSFHHQPEAQHPKSSAIHNNAGRLPHLSANSGHRVLIRSPHRRGRAVLVHIAAAVGIFARWPSFLTSTTEFEYGQRHSEVVQPDQRVWIYSNWRGGGGKDVFVHISAVEKAGLSTLNEGQTVEYEEIPNKGKTSEEESRKDRVTGKDNVGQNLIRSPYPRASLIAKGDNCSRKG